MKTNLEACLRDTMLNVKTMIQRMVLDDADGACCSATGRSRDSIDVFFGEMGGRRRGG